ncbi:MAG: Asp-tRNA(Asn)/Glu-tRNA(Gln) amidotransferase subunit GatC [Planctomycetes bacterium]|nr:Asp-tRNA(Asn)/Glu-tRNA(Gln) amidotransferase subunit GatC [Planctomycetota bacterium]
MIDAKTVNHIAKLAALKISPEEEAAYAGQLQKILGHIEKLNALDTSGAEPLSHALELKNVFREDAFPHSDKKTAEMIMENSPEKAAPFFKVPKVIE